MSNEPPRLPFERPNSLPLLQLLVAHVGQPNAAVTFALSFADPVAPAVLIHHVRSEAAQFPLSGEIPVAEPRLQVL